MKKINPIYFIMIVMLCAGLFMVGRSAYRIYNRKPLVTETAKDSEAKKQLAAVRTQDIEVLKKAAERPPAEVAKSLRRLQRQSSADAGEFIKQFISSENELIRAAAVESAAALGLSEFEGPIRAAVSSNSIDLRMAAIKGLQQKPNEFSSSLILAHWKRGIQTPKERFVTLLALQRIDAPDKKAQWQAQLVSELRAFKGNSHPEEWVDTFKSLPANDELLAGAWDIVRRADATEVSFRALLYIRDFAGPEMLKNELSTVSIPAHRRFQMALIDMLFDYCPSGWSEIVKRIMTSEPHPTVKKGLEEAELSVKCL